MSEMHGNVGPIFLSRDEEPGKLRFDVPYQLITVLSKIYPYVSKGKIAVICRRCDEKALNELIKRDLFDRERIVKIGLACDEKQIAICRCADPVPSKVDLGEAHKGIDEDDLASELNSSSLEDRFGFWIRQFRKCNKCYACSTNCPVCICDDCVLEERNFVPDQGIPPGLAFHLIRAMHLADKCIECGECERACPGNIPLLTFRKMTNRDMRDLFGYTPGDPDRSSPLLTTLEGDPLEGESHEC